MRDSDEDDPFMIYISGIFYWLRAGRLSDREIDAYGYGQSGTDSRTRLVGHGHGQGLGNGQLDLVTAFV